MTTYNLIINLIILVFISNKRVVTLQLQKPFIYTVAYFVYRLLLNTYYNQDNPPYGLVFFCDLLVLMWYSQIFSKAEKVHAIKYGSSENLELKFQRSKKDRMIQSFKNGKMRLRLKKTK